jgi:thermolysin metallopeptidase-like protein/fungalysin/thermolysin propeptide
MLALFLSLAAAAPAQRFVDAHPASTTIRSMDGRVLVHASGFLAANPGRTPEATARSFLSTHGSAFGVADPQDLALRQAPPPGQVGAVRFERTLAGLPVFGGDVVVGVDEKSRVFLVNAGDVAGTPSGRHALGEVAAIGSALSSLSGNPSGAVPTNVAAGWRRVLGSLRPVYRVDVIVERPSGSWRIFVDGETGRSLFRQTLRQSLSAPGNVYAVSPSETPNALCPVTFGVRTLCASPLNVTIPNLVAATDLAGTQTIVFNCNGANFPTQLPAPACSPVPALVPGNTYNYPADTAFTSLGDNFSAVMAYYHLDKHVTFFKTLDPTLPGGTHRAVNGALPAFVNAFSGGQRFENAFYDSNIDAMVFGQGARADFAYDATVMYHELTHGVVQAWGGFNLDIDGKGSVFEPAGLNEGTADSMAVSETGRSALGAFLASLEIPPEPAFRDMSDPDATRSCQGNGTRAGQFGVPDAINGLSGEEHADGEIWNGFYWEVFEGLRAAGVKACGGNCEAGPAVQYKALQLSAGTAPTFGTYWQTFKSAAAALFPQQPSIASYVDCVARRRNFDKCDRTLPVFAGEEKVQLVKLRYSPFQIVIPATSATGIVVCSNSGSTSLLHARKDLPVALTAIDPNTGDATFTEDLRAAVPRCSSTVTPIGLPSAGNWHLLFDLPGAFIGSGPPQDLFLTAASSTGVAARPLPPLHSPCSAGPLGIIAPSTNVAPKDRLDLAAANGGTTGFAWSISANRSGGSIDALSGTYTAGATGSVTDTVMVTDSAGGSATKDITLTPGVSISPASPSIAPKGTVNFTATGGSGSGFTWGLAMNASGGSIVAASGAYTAGSKAGVTDIVAVSDSLGNTAAVTVTVPAPGGGGCATGDGSGPAFAILLAALLLRRGRLRPGSSEDSHR